MYGAIVVWRFNPTEQELGGSIMKIATIALAAGIVILSLPPGLTPVWTTVWTTLVDIAESAGNEPQPGYNPLDTLKGTPHEGDDLSIYLGSHNETYTRALMALTDRHALAAASGLGAEGSALWFLASSTLLTGVWMLCRGLAAAARAFVGRLRALVVTLRVP
jgi:hypothetical protein